MYVCIYMDIYIYIYVYGCMCIHLQEHQKRPVIQRIRRGILHVEIASGSYPPRASCSGTALMAPLTLSCSLSHQTHLTRLILFDQYSQDTYPSCSVRMRVLPLGPSVDLAMGPRSAVGRRRRMRVPPLGPSVELPMGPRNVVLGARDAYEFRHWDLRWSSLWGHETLHWAQETHASSAGDDPFATGA